MCDERDQLREQVAALKSEEKTLARVQVRPPRPPITNSLMSLEVLSPGLSPTLIPNSLIQAVARAIHTYTHTHTHTQS
jgi:hypothetical protein